MYLRPHQPFVKVKHMRLLFFAVATSFFSCGVSLPAGSSPPPRAGDADTTFESPGFVDANRFVPAPMMSGSLHSVGGQAFNNGLQNSYQLTDSGTTRDILGTPLLLQRIKEIYAIDSLRRLSKTDEFTKALARAAGDKVNSVINIAKDPIGTVKNLPKGASRFFGSVGEGLKSTQGGNAGNALEAASGMSKAKAQLAFKLGVSPYSDNQELQEQLSNVAWAMAGGGLVLGAAGMIVPGAAGTTLTAVGGNQILQNQLIDTPPSQLRILNRKKLFALGLDRDMADAFLMQTSFTPANATIIVDALSRIGVNPEAFLNEADAVNCPEDAFYFQRLAQLLLLYPQTVAPIMSLHVKDGLVCALDKNGVLVVPVSLDYAIWSERVANRVYEFSKLVSMSNSKVKSLTLWTDGQLSQRLCEELSKRNISYQIIEPERLIVK